MVVSLAGTATSDRYRAPQIARNAYNMVALHPGRIVVREWRYHPGTGAFVAGDAQAFARGRPTAG